MEFWAQKITTVLAIIAGLIIAFYAGISAGDSDLKTIIGIIGIIIFLFVYFSLYKFYWVVVLSSVFIPGNLNFIPAGLQTFEVLLIMGAARFLFDQIIFGSKNIKVGPLAFFICLTAMVLILFYHGLGDRFGMRIFGSSSWGGRAYIGVFFAFIAYIIFQTIPFDRNVWKWFPMIAFFPPTLDAAIRMLTKLVPSTAAMIYPIYGGVTLPGMDMVVDSMDANTIVQDSRMGEFASIGAPLLLLVLCYCRLKNIWRPKNWVYLSLLSVSLILSVMGGYRSSVLGAICVLGAAGFRDFRFAIWLPATAFALLVSGVISYHSFGGWDMPLGAQRALVFLPGKWDQKVIDSAKGSDEFRFETWENWRIDHFSVSPAIGRGFGFDASVMRDIQGAYDRKDDSLLRKTLLLTGELHNGFLSVVDRIGILGACFFIMWWVLTLMLIYRVLNEPHLNNYNPALLWCGLYLSSSTLFYVIGSLRFDTFFAEQIVFVGLMIRLVRDADEKKLKDLEDAAVAS